jgi:hypothetical protein
MGGGAQDRWLVLGGSAVLGALVPGTVRTGRPSLHSGSLVDEVWRRQAATRNRHVLPTRERMSSGRPCEMNPTAMASMTARANPDRAQPRLNHETRWHSNGAWFIRISQGLDKAGGG